MSDLDDDDRALVEQLRALPVEGEEPDWRALEAGIRAEVAPLSMPIVWWKNWRWLAPIGALAMTAALVLVVAIRHDGGGAPTTPERTALRDDASVPQVVEAPRAPDDDPAARAPAMWLDGEAVDLDGVSPESLDALASEATADSREARDDDAAGIRVGDDSAIDGMLPVADDRWIDALDDEAAARLEQFLARKRS